MQPAEETQKKPEEAAEKQPGSSMKRQREAAEETQKKPEVQPAEEAEPPPSQGSLSATTLSWGPPGSPWDSDHGSQ